MKRILPLFFVLVIGIFVTGSAAAADNFCMDCTIRLVEQGDRTVVEAQCCMAMGGHCYTSDVLKDEDVGSGCKISVPDANGSTSCSSTTEDKGCPPAGGGTKRSPHAGFEGDNPCMYDWMGWCDTACRTCSWG